MEFYRYHFGKRLKEARKRIPGLTQEKLAELVGVEGASVSRWEKGHDFPDESRVPDICRAIKVDLDYFDPTKPDFAAAADFLAKFAGLPPVFQKMVLALVYQDESYTRGIPIPPEARSLIQKLFGPPAKAKP